MFFVEDAFLVTFHRKSHAVGKRDAVHAIGIAVEVEFQHFLRIKVADVRAQPGRIFIFRSIHQNTGAGIRPGFEREMIDAVRTGHGAAQPAAIGQALGEGFLPDFRIDLMGIRVRTVAIVVRRQQVEMIHDLDDVGRAHFAHLVLLVVQIGDFLVDALTRLADERHIGHAVFVAAHVAETHHNRLDLLIAEDAPRAAAPGLLETGFLAAHVVPGGVDHRNAGMFRRLPGGKHRDGAFALFVAAKALGQDVADQMRIDRFERIAFDRHLAGVAVDEDDHILSALPWISSASKPENFRNGAK